MESLKALKALNEIAEFYGIEAQAHQLVEEMAELTQALNKLWRKSQKGNVNPVKAGDAEIRSHIAEEIADVKICLYQVEYLLMIGNGVDDWMDQKIDRQIERISEGDTDRIVKMLEKRGWSVEFAMGEMVISNNEVAVTALMKADPDEDFHTYFYVCSSNDRTDGHLVSFHDGCPEDDEYYICEAVADAMREEQQFREANKSAE